VPPRILIFVALSGDGPRAAAGVACTLAPPGSARPLSLDPVHLSPEVRPAADRLAELLDLRPVANEIALLGHITELLRERPNATIVIDAPRPGAVVRLVEAADLARAHLDTGRPDASTSSLAAARAAERAELPILQAAATAGDLIRAPELTTVGLLAGPAAQRADERTARAALALVGIGTLEPVLPAASAKAAAALYDHVPGSPGAGHPAPVTTVTPSGAQLRVALPSLPDDLRAVRSGQELVLQAGGSSRRLHAPVSLGPLIPGAISAGEDGTVIAEFLPDSTG